jgi:hypothetical protein
MSFPIRTSLHRISLSRAGGNQWWQMEQEQAPLGFEVYGRCVVTVSGTFRNLKTAGTLGAAQTRTTVLRRSSNAGTRVGGGAPTVTMADTALSVAYTEPTTSGEDTSNDVHVDAGDVIAWQSNSSPGALPTSDIIHASHDFEPDVENETPYFWANGTHGSGTRYVPMFTGNSGGLDTSITNVLDLIAVPCTLTRYDPMGWNTPGGTDGFQFCVMLNGVAQDGSVGTVDTRCSFTGVNYTTTWTGSLSLARGDLVALRVTNIGTPTTMAIGCGSKLVSTIPGLYNKFISQIINPSATVTVYRGFESRITFEVTEGDVKTMGGVTDLRLSGGIVRHSAGTVGPLPQSITVTGRLNEGAVTDGPLIVATGTVASGIWEDTSDGELTITSADYFSIRHAPASTPNVANPFNMSFMAGVPEPLTGVLLVTQLACLVFSDAIRDTDIPPVAANCTGGGTVPTGTAPGSGTSLATARSPQFWIEIDVAGASPTTLRYAKGAMADSDSYKEPRVLSFGPVVRALADPQGNFETASVEVILADHDYAIRDRMEEVWDGRSETDAFVGRPARIYGRDLTGAAGTQQLVFEGLIREMLPQATLTVKAVIEDALSDLVTATFSDAALVPKALISSDVSEASPIEEMIDKPFPLAYGSLSDEHLEDDAVGVVPARHVGTLDGLSFFLVCLGAVKNIQSAFGADYISSFAEPTDRIKFPTSAWGDWAFAPHQAGWPYGDPWIEIDGKRYTGLLLDPDHTVARLGREGRVPISVNMCGYESTGDTTGTLIDSMERQLLHFLINFVFGSYDGTGDWETTVPLLGTYSAIDTASFEATKTAGEEMVDGGFVGATLIAHDLKQRTAREVIAQFCRSGAMEVGFNRFGQLMLTRLNRAGGTPAFTRSDLADIIRGSFMLTPIRDEVVDVVPYVYGRNYLPAMGGVNPDTGARLPQDTYRGQWTSGYQQTIGTGRRAQVQEYEMLRDAELALTVATLLKDLRGKPRLMAEWEERLTGTDVDLGDLGAVTHFRGTGTGGWSERTAQVRRHVLDPDRRTVKLTARDVGDLFDYASGGWTSPSGGSSQETAATVGFTEATDRIMAGNVAQESAASVGLSEVASLSISTP